MNERKLIDAQDLIDKVLKHGGINHKWFAELIRQQPAVMVINLDEHNESYMKGEHDD